MTQTMKQIKVIVCYLNVLISLNKKFRDDKHYSPISKLIINLKSRV